MEELRTQIWDYLYRASQPMTLDEIAKNVGGDTSAIRTATQHEWFETVTDRVSIAYGKNPTPPVRISN